MQKILSALRGALGSVRRGVVKIWKRFRMLARWAQAVVIAVLIALIFGVGTLLSGSTPASDANASRTVTLRSVAELSGNASGDSVVGSVRAHAEAELRAEASGAVKGVHTTIGATVPAGFVIAELENATEAAAVLQAEGAYDAAIAGRTSVSPVDAATSARNTYQSAFSTLETTVTTNVDAFFGGPTGSGPSVVLNHTLTSREQMSRERVAITTSLNAWRTRLASASATTPTALLDEAEAVTRQVQTLVEELARSANDAGSGASETQLAALSSARASVNSVLASLAAARATFRSNSTGSTASVDASVKSALGTLRLAQANLEKTRVRAPISGTVNFLPIRVGDYVNNLDHVATVAQNGALEIVAFISEEARGALEVGAKVMVEDTYPGTITSIAPALDPVTKQIEMNVSVDGNSGLVNGQSVRLTLPGAASTATATSTGPILLPLSAVKLSAGNRVVFAIGENGRLKALPVEIGEVRGERIEILSSLSADTRIVEDARGLSDGQQVKIAGVQ